MYRCEMLYSKVLYSKICEVEGRKEKEYMMTQKYLYI